MTNNRHVAEHFPAEGIFATYDLVRLILSCGRDRRWKQQALRTVGSGYRCHVDIGTGSGDMLAHARLASVIVGLDREVVMLALARRRPSDTFWVTGDVCAMPFKSGAVDLVTAAYVLRYIHNPLHVLRGLREVLRPGGILLIYDLVTPSSRLARAVLLTYLAVATTLMGLFLHGDVRRYWHLWRTVSTFSLDHIISASRTAGFTIVAATTAGGGTVACVVARSP